MVKRTSVNPQFRRRESSGFHNARGRRVFDHRADRARIEEPNMLAESEAACRYLRTPEAGYFLGLSGRTLEKHRTYGTGPTYRKIGGRVVYALKDLKAWADRGLQSSTTDRPGRVRPAKPVAEPLHSAPSF